MSFIFSINTSTSSFVLKWEKEKHEDEQEWEREKFEKEMLYKYGEAARKGIGEFLAKEDKPATNPVEKQEVEPADDKNKPSEKTEKDE